MLKIQTEIFIEATPETVWNHLTDFKSYPTWNPFITHIKEIDKKTLHIEISSGRSANQFKAVIIKRDPGKELRWIGRLGNIKGIFSGEHYFILSKVKKGTHFLHGENFSGLLAVLLWPFIRKDIHCNFIKMNEALRILSQNKKA